MTESQNHRVYISPALLLPLPLTWAAKCALSTLLPASTSLSACTLLLAASLAPPPSRHTLASKHSASALTKARERDLLISPMATPSSQSEAYFPLALLLEATLHSAIVLTST